MSEKTPIKVKDIREGDLVRIESRQDDGDAREYRATRDAQTPWARTQPHFLLDRPETFVKVPQSAIDKLRSIYIEHSTGLELAGAGASAVRKLLQQTEAL